MRDRLFTQILWLDGDVRAARGRQPRDCLSTRYTLHPTRYTLHATPYTIHAKRCTLHATRYTLHATRYTLHPAPVSLSQHEVNTAG